MSAAMLRSAGLASCSGRPSFCTPNSPTKAPPRTATTRWHLATKGSQPRSPIVPHSSPPDEIRPAPSLTDGTSPQSEPAQPKVVLPLTNASNYKAMAAVASVGVVETAYLAYVKLFNVTLVCPTNGCESVLTSPYAQLFGLPLSLYGMLAYGTVAALALSYAQLSSQTQPSSDNSSSGGEAGAGLVPRRVALLGLTAGVGALATTSAVLISILQTRFGGTPCAYCYLSAALSATLAVTLLSTLSRSQLKDNAGAGVGAALATAALLYFGLPNAASTNGTVFDENFFLEYRLPEVSSPSSDRARDLARRLRAVGAHMYGAFWCSHCLEQKEEFGGQAMADFPYVECFPNGWRQGEKIAPACETANIRAFPTWVIGGKTLEGQLELGEVERELLRAEREAAADNGVAVSAAQS